MTADTSDNACALSVVEPSTVRHSQGRDREGAVCISSPPFHDGRGSDSRRSRDEEPGPDSRHGLQIAPIQIGPAVIGPGYPVYVIAEAGVNHDGDAMLARELIHAAAEAGADAVKFQVFSADRLVTRRAPAAAYQKAAVRADSQYDMLARLELAWDDFAQLAEVAGREDLEFLATPFSVADLRFLLSMPVRALKLASPDIINTELLEAAAAGGVPVIASTGAADLDEIAFGVNYFRAHGGGPLALLHCISSYPAPEEEANLAAIAVLVERFRCVCGYSDHTESTRTGGYAVAAGACIVEKHLTLDRKRPGPDHGFSLEPRTFAEYVRDIRLAERLMGRGRIEVSACQREARLLARGSVVAARDIRAGEPITRAMLTVKRPGDGIAPAQIEQLIGRCPLRDITADTALTWDDLA
ncbi:MAG: N-acetylneuraminate synthase family protein [Phycisphaerae bacterium]